MPSSCKRFAPRWTVSKLDILVRVAPADILGLEPDAVPRNGECNPRLTDQTRMHADNEFKVIEMSPEIIKATVESTQTIDYVLR